MLADDLIRYRFVQTPEPPLEPPEPPEDLCPLCGFEFKEWAYTWEDCEICEECMQEKVDEMELHEIAALLGSTRKKRGE